MLHSVFSGLSAASSEVTASSGASLLRDSRAAEDITARDEVLETADQEQLHAESAKCTCTTSKGANGSNETVTVPAPTSPEVLQRSFSSSTLSSAAGMSRTSSLNGRKKPPTAYRKEMESVLFAQSASPSASSSSSSSNNKRIHSGSSSGGRFCSSTIPTLTSSIFSTPTPDSIWYTHPSDISASSAYSSKSRSSSSLSTTSPISPSSNVSIESIPFLVDAPTLIDRTRLKHNNSYNQNDRFYIGGHNSIVVHVNDLNWYLEKVLWKLGLHRKGRKEFMSVSFQKIQLAYLVVSFLLTLGSKKYSGAGTI